MSKTSVRPERKKQVESAEAVVAREIETTWRNWHAYLQELQDTIDGENVVDDDLMESSAKGIRKAKIDPATRAQFAGVVESRRQRAQADEEADARKMGRAATDNDQVYRQVISTMRKEVAGEVHSMGLALFMYKGQMIKFDAASVRTGTTEADYTAVGASTAPTPRMMAMAGSGVVAMLILVGAFLRLFLFPDTSVPVDAKAPTIMLGDKAIDLWWVQQAQIGSVSVPVRMQGQLPPTLCVADTTLREMTPTDTIVLTSTGSVRTYQLTDDRTNAHLRIGTCSGEVTRDRAAQLTTTQQSVIPEDDLVVTTFASDTNPTDIPASQVLVRVTVPTMGSSAALITFDGRTFAPTRRVPQDQMVVLEYLVPAGMDDHEAGMVITQAGMPIRYPISIPLARTRADLLRTWLTVQVMATPDIVNTDTGPVLQVPVMLAWSADASYRIVVQATDITALLVQGGSAMQVTWQAVELDPDGRSNAVIRVPLDQPTVGAGLTLSLGNWTGRITVQ